jgi:hypothetical protein
VPRPQELELVAGAVDQLKAVTPSQLPLAKASDICEKRM